MAKGEMPQGGWILLFWSEPENLSSQNTVADTLASSDLEYVSVTSKAMLDGLATLLTTTLLAVL